MTRSEMIESILRDLINNCDQDRETLKDMVTELWTKGFKGFDHSTLEEIKKMYATAFDIDPDEAKFDE